ncbi:MAG: type VI secretion system protein TssA [Desulfobacteraceae bacterium]
MTNFDLDALLAEISSDAPCGEDISYDAVFLELERIAEGTAETQVGDYIQEGVEPDWKKICQLSLDLLERSRDLRLIIYLTAAMLRLEGISGLSNGLALLRALVEQHWDHLFPQLDPEDDNDPLERMNIIGSLSPPATVMNDPMKFIPQLMGLPLCKPEDARLPHMSLRHILLASGEIAPSETEEGDVPSMQLIDAAFEQTDLVTLKTTDRVIGDCLEHLSVLDQVLTDYVGVSAAPNFNRLDRVLKQMRSKTAMYLERRGYPSSDRSSLNQTEAKTQNQLDMDTPNSKEPPMDTENQSDSGLGSRGQQLSGSITSNQEVLKALDMILAYYQQSEPSSPVPLLIKRAKRLVGKSFVDIIRDLSPDAMAQVKMVSGDKDQPKD